MTKKKYKYIYGPVPSWRLGSSLGVDPISGKNKVCTFDCIYCQIGKTKAFTTKRKVFIPVAKIIKEIKSLPPLKIDYITFSGAGEPTLAKNLGQIIKAVRRIRKEKIAVLTNSSLIYRKDVQNDLSAVDFVVAKLDAHCQNLFIEINQPVKTIKLDKIIRGIKQFKKTFSGKLALQIMFIKENKKYAKQIAKIAKGINPDKMPSCPTAYYFKGFLCFLHIIFSDNLYAGLDSFLNLLRGFSFCSSYQFYSIWQFIQYLLNIFFNCHYILPLRLSAAFRLIGATFFFLHS